MGPRGNFTETVAVGGKRIVWLPRSGATKLEPDNMEATKSRLVSFCLTNKASGRAKGESHESVAWFSKGRANLLSHRKTLPFSLSLSPMATETQSAPAAPELTILNRVASIPLVNDTFTAM